MVLVSLVLLSFQQLLWDYKAGAPLSSLGEFARSVVLP